MKTKSYIKNKKSLSGKVYGTDLKVANIEKVAQILGKGLKIVCRNLGVSNFVLCYTTDEFSPNNITV